MEELPEEKETILSHFVGGLLWKKKSPFEGLSFFSVGGGPSSPSLLRKSLLEMLLVSDREALLFVGKNLPLIGKGGEGPGGCFALSEGETA